MNNYDVFLSINGKKIKGNVVNESYTSSVGEPGIYTLSVSFLNPKQDKFRVWGEKIKVVTVFESDEFDISFTEKDFKKLVGGRK